MNVELALASNNGTSSGGKTLFVVIAVVIILIGLLQVAKPDLSWRMARWQYKNKSALQPSSAGLMAARIGGAVAAAVGVVILVTGLNR